MHGRHSLLQVRMLEPALLALLQAQPEHGYILTDRLNKFGLGTIDPSIIYRMLRQMEELGWVTSTWDAQEALGPPRRIYQLTDDGRQRLAGWRKELTSVEILIQNLLKEIE